MEGGIRLASMPVNNNPVARSGSIGSLELLMDPESVNLSCGASGPQAVQCSRASPDSGLCLTEEPRFLVV